MKRVLTFGKWKYFGVLFGVLFCVTCAACKTVAKTAPTTEVVKAEETVIAKEADAAALAAYKQAKYYRILFKDRESYPSLKEGVLQSCIVLYEAAGESKADEALEALKKGDVRLAINYLQAAYVQNMKNDPAYALRCLRYSGLLQMFVKPQVGINVLKRVMEREPENYQAMMNLGIYLNRMRKFSDSDMILRKSLYFARSANDTAAQARILGELGYSSRMRGKGKQAKEYFLESVEKSRVAENKIRVASGLFQLGMTCELLKDTYCAEIYYSRAMKEYDELGWKKDIAAMNLKLGRLYVDKQNWLLSEGYIRKAVSGYQSSGYKLGLAMSYLLYADFYKGQVKRDSALASYSKAQDIYESLKMREHVAKIYKETGFIKFDQGNVIKAMDDWIAALKIYKDVGADSEVDVLYSLLGVASIVIGDVSGAVDFMQQGIKERTRETDEFQKATSMIILGRHENNRGNYPKAKTYFAEARRFAREHSLPWAHGVAAYWLATLHFKLGNLQKAELFYKESLGPMEELKDLNMVASINSALGAIYFKQKQYDRSKECVLKARSIREQDGEKDLVRFFDYTLQKIEKQLK